MNLGILGLSASRPRPCRNGFLLGIIALAAVAAYAGSFGGPFMFDDLGSIPDNPTIRSLWTGLSPPLTGATVSGRPVLNLTLAVNYALGGAGVWSYHALNLAIHILAGMTLFGVLRRTLAKIGSPRSAELAFAAALLWTIDPIQTESVTYIIQRAESLMGLFYLLTVYFYIRYTEWDSNGIFTGRSGRKTLEPSANSYPPEHSHAGLLPDLPDLPVKKNNRTTAASRPSCKNALAILSVIACLFGMATKEVMVTAPVIVLLYDRTFLSGSFRAAWRARRAYYICLGCTWLVVGALAASTQGRGGTAGLGSGVAWWDYFLTQFRAIAHYLRLAIWPHPLLFDYGRALGGPPLQIALDALLVLALAGGAGFLLLRRSGRPAALGFAGAWFFLILAPSSSIVPISTEIIAEHRMYLPLAAFIAAEVWAADAAIAWLTEKAGMRWGWLRPGLCAALAAVFLLLTSQRNQEYASPPVSIWSDQVTKSPRDPSAHYELGQSLLALGKSDQAEAEFKRALALKPDYSEALVALGTALAQTGRLAEAIGHLERAVALEPDYAAAHANLGVALAQSGRLAESIDQFQQAARLDPSNAEIRHDLDLMLQEAERLRDGN